jgi:hypothetical protein
MTTYDLIIGGSDGVLIRQLGRMSNRHGLVAGATGTGKTETAPYPRLLCRMVGNKFRADGPPPPIHR